MKHEEQLVYALELITKLLHACAPAIKEEHYKLCDAVADLRERIETIKKNEGGKMLSPFEQRVCIVFEVITNMLRSQLTKLLHEAETSEHMRLIDQLKNTLTHLEAATNAIHKDTESGD